MKNENLTDFNLKLEENIIEQYMLLKLKLVINRLLQKTYFQVLNFLLNIFKLENQKFKPFKKLIKKIL